MKVIEINEWRESKQKPQSTDVFDSIDKNIMLHQSNGSMVMFGQSTRDQLQPYLSRTFIVGLTHKETNGTTVMLTTGTDIKDIVWALEHFFNEAEDNSWTIPALMAYYDGCLFDDYSITILESIESGNIEEVIERSSYWAKEYQNN